MTHDPGNAQPPVVGWLVPLECDSDECVPGEEDSECDSASECNFYVGMNAIFAEERLVSMTLVNGKTIHRCMTIATSLQEALQRARMHYKQPMLELNGWGSRGLPIESRLIGGGYFIRSSRDEGHRHSLAQISSLR